MDAKDRRAAILAVGLALLLVAAGLALGSDMGFRFKPALDLVARDYWLSLPFRSTYRTAQDLCAAIGPDATLVSRYDPSGQIRVDWLCPLGVNFELTPGEGYAVRVGDVARPVLVGSHDPNLRVPLGGFRYVGRDYLLSLPYHTTATVAADLCGEIPGAILVSAFDTETGFRRDWVCPVGDNFVIVPGMAVAVRVAFTNEGWIPSHY